MLLSKLIIRETVDSTNNYIANLVKSDKIQHGTAILSYFQENGRGQRGTEWTSSPHTNLALSIYLKHQNKRYQDVHLLSFSIALAVKDLLVSYDLPAKIKWPNDILVNDKKICGILIENQFTSSGWQSSIVGIGINVNENGEQYPTATSMTKLLNRTFNLESLSYELIEKMDKRYQQFTQNNPPIKEEYLLSLWKKDEWTTAIIDNKEHTVQIKGTSETGLLLVKVENEVKTFDLKEIKFLY